jgi:hypothetical protein
MSYIDNDPPKHTDIGSLTHPERLSIFQKTRLRFEGRNKGKVFFTLDEIKVLILKENIVPKSGPFSKKEYKKALEMKERAQKYLQEEKQQKENTDLSI